MPTHDKARAYTKLTTALVLAAVALVTLPVALAQAGDGGTGTGDLGARRGAPARRRWSMARRSRRRMPRRAVVRVIERREQDRQGQGLLLRRWPRQLQVEAATTAPARSATRSTAAASSAAPRPPAISCMGPARARASGSPSTRTRGHVYMTVAGLRFDTSMTRARARLEQADALRRRATANVTRPASKPALQQSRLHYLGRLDFGTSAKAPATGRGFRCRTCCPRQCGDDFGVVLV